MNITKNLALSVSIAYGILVAILGEVMDDDSHVVTVVTLAGAGLVAILWIFAKDRTNVAGPPEA